MELLHWIVSVGLLAFFASKVYNSVQRYREHRCTPYMNFVLFSLRVLVYFRMATSTSVEQVTKIEFPVVSVCYLLVEPTTWAVLTPEDILTVPVAIDASDVGFSP